MFKFNAGAMRPAAGDARFAAAQDLVNCTLAKHGLSGGVAMPSFDAPQTAKRDDTMTAGTFRCSAGSREYLVYVPAKARDGATGLIVMLHGCTQSPADFAKGTGMNALADIGSFIVVYPQQSRGDNAQSCWNWFSRADQRRDGGEPAIIAGLAQDIAAQHGIAPAQTCVAGLSAGAAMAVILGQTYPDVFAAVGAHSGLPYGAARDVPSAFAAMAGQGGVPVAPNAPRSDVRTIVFHGTQDTTVVPANGERIGQAAKANGAAQTLENETRGQTNGRGYSVQTSSDMEGTSVVEHWVIDGLGHAWSGGQAGGSYTDPKGPDASAQMVRFFFNPTAQVAQ